MTTNQFSVLVVDDEPESRNLLKKLLSEISYVTLIGEADNAESALYKIVEHYPNLVLMDINMPRKSGTQLLELLVSRHVDVPIVFVSANEKYAIMAMRNHIYDFLLKPVVPDELKNVIEKYRRLNKKDLPERLMEVLGSIREESKIRINSRYSYLLINPSEIVYCVSEGGYTVLHLTSGKTVASNTSLTQIKTKVGEHSFYRLGRSVLLNIHWIRTINKWNNSVLLKCNERNWEVFASHKSIKELLQSNVSYA